MSRPTTTRKAQSWTTHQRLATTEARRMLPGLVRELSEQTTPAASLLDRAVEIGPRSKGGTFLVSEVDARAAVTREDELRQKVEVLEDELENLAIAMLLEERLAASSGTTTPIEDVVRELGFAELLQEEQRHPRT